MSTVGSTSTTQTSTTSTTANALSQLIANSGNASGLNDNAIIAELVSIESQPITNLQNQQTALQSQISQIAQISSALKTLATAAQTLQSDGAVGLTAGDNTGFVATASLGAQAGTYQINVGQLAIAAKTRSQGFSSSTNVTGGTLSLTVQGKAFSLDIADGTSLSDVAASLNDLGAPISASVISDGINKYLSLTDTQSGFDPSGTAASALALSFASTGTTGQALAFTPVTTAQNALLTVDNLAITSQSNTVTGVIPGITLNLTAKDTAPETLNIQADTQKTAANVQTFVTAYNSVMALVQSQLNVTATTDRTSTLAGDPTLRDLQQRLQGLFTATISEAPDINSLPAIGLSTSGTDGSLSLDQTQLSAALAKNPNAINALFGLSADSISQLASQIGTDYTDPVTGSLAVRTQGINGEISDLTTQESDLQAQVNSYQQNLIQQFSNLESIVSLLKSSNSFLTAASNAASSKTG